MTEKDLYAALGVPRTARPTKSRRRTGSSRASTIRTSIPATSEAEERFKAISEANDVLGDPEKRKLYDEFGMAGVQSGFDADAGARPSRAGGRMADAAAAAEGEGFGGYS